MIMRELKLSELKLCQKSIRGFCCNLRTGETVQKRYTKQDITDIVLPQAKTICAADVEDDDIVQEVYLYDEPQNIECIEMRGKQLILILPLISNYNEHTF